jgi:hypothetical protein
VRIGRVWFAFLVLSLLSSYGFSYIFTSAITISSWQPIFNGVDQATGAGTTLDGRLQKMVAIRIDLYDDDIIFFATPSNGSDPLDTTRQTASQFMATSGVQVGINANFYVPSGSYANLDGVSISQGNIVSPAENLYSRLNVDAGALLIRQDNTATFLANINETTNLTGYWTAIESWPFVLKTGVNLGDPSVVSANINPRSAVGLSLDNRYLFLMTIDGRQPGYSEGATAQETGVWLVLLGSHNGIILDGGGSTHLWISQYNGGTYPLNSPSENRAVGNHLGVYAAPLPSIPYTENCIYADFENGNASTFAYSPGYSGSTFGIDASSSATVVTEQSYLGSGSQKLTIVDNTTQLGGWFVRHVSGGSASRSNNSIRPTTGYVGFWAKTASSGCQISIAIDNTNNVTADRGVFKNMPADNQWHLYEWNLEDNNDWDAWASGDGIIDTVDFTIDSIQIQNSSDIDAIIYLDEIAHNPRVSLKYMFSTVGDFEPDSDVDLADFAMMAGHWLSNDSEPDFNRLYDLATPYNNIVDFTDFAVFAKNWLGNN